jgi:hypothetical protein
MRRIAILGLSAWAGMMLDLISVTSGVTDEKYIRTAVSLGAGVGSDLCRSICCI